MIAIDLRYLNDNTMILNYQLLGTEHSDTIVLLHGLLGNAQNLNLTAKYLADNYQVVNIDLRNHGRSPHSETHTYSAMADDVIETLNSLNIKKFSVMGHSMGGKTAMMLALNCPDKVDKLIVADIAPVNYPDRHQSIFNGLQAINLSTIQSRQDADKQLAKYVAEAGIRQFLLTNLYNNDNQWAWKMNLKALASQYAHISQFKVEQTQSFKGPTLFIKGGDSDYIQSQHQPAIQLHFPNAKAKIIQGAGHWIHAEKPKIFNKVLLDFLQK